MKRPILLLLLLSSLSVACSTRAATRDDRASALAAASSSPAASAAAIDASEALRDVRYLAGPALEGRGALTHGLAAAGDYIAGRFQAAGLAPAGDGGTFFQEVGVPVGNQAGPRMAFSVDGETLALGEDFVPNKASASTRAVGGAVFAGYGIAVPGRYDDYAGLDVRGKLVVCLRYGPRYDAKSGKLADAALEDAALIGRKVRAAAERGAIGIAIIDLEVGAETRGPLPALTYRAGQVGKSIASFQLSPAVVHRLWLSRLGRDFADIRQTIDETGRPVTFALPGVVSFDVQWIKSTVRSRNVLALLPGSDPALRDEVVIVGAHYDHLGLGDEGSALDGPGLIHPGADDNASGTAAVLEIAEAFARAPTRPRRSLLFAAFTGEERGLLGSEVLAASAGTRQHWTMRAMINLDMVGRLTDNGLEIGGAPTSPDWEATVKAANSDGLKLNFPKRVVANSDHASFLRKNVPALFLFTGMHPDYHRVSDTWDKVNTDGLVKVARLAYRVARAVADRPAPLAFVAPSWTRGGTGAAGSHGGGVRLGVMPDYQAESGLRISAVLPGGPAAAAGLAAGDVIETMGGQVVADIDAYMEILASFKPGDQTMLSVRRDGAERPVKVTFTPVPANPTEDKP
ncbi:MAG TPA: M20/M25/M40 family metallo-hydrolase [Polyangia bacterium]|nr:M20/M25/M40 family metallo-hydrolase [Polyangia bacterium]